VKINSTLLVLLASLCATALRAQTTAAPVITLGTGSYQMPTSTTITDSTPGASILWCYTASGTCTPNTSYTAAIYLNPASTETICANATASGCASPTVCNDYTRAEPQTATPSIALGSGTYAMPTRTTITDPTSGASILWCRVRTGTCTPDTPYATAIRLEPIPAETICANATSSAHTPSGTACNSYRGRHDQV
jgi:hypothetical protein